MCGVVCVHVEFCVVCMWCCVCGVVHVVLCVCLSSYISLSLFFSSLFFFTARTETRSDRQVSPPTKNGHAPRDPLNQEFSLLLSPSPLFFFFFFFSFLYPCLSRSLLSHAQL